MCQLHAVQEKPSPWLVCYHHPIPCRSDMIRFSDVWVLMFERSMGRTAPPTHCLSHQLQITAEGPSGHGRRHPAVAHPPPTLRLVPGGGAPSQGPGREGRSAGPGASEHPRLRLEFGKSSGGQRLLCRGGLRSGLCCCLGGSCLEGMYMWEVDGS